MAMIKRDLFTLHQGLQSVGDFSGVKFSYAVAKNKKMVFAEIELLQESIKPINGIEEYEKKRVDLCKKYSKLDGEPAIVNNEYMIKPSNQKAFDKQLDLLVKEHKEDLSARKKQVDEYNKLLDEPIELNLHKVSIDNVPEAITPKQMEGIMEIVDAT